MDIKLLIGASVGALATAFILLFGIDIVKRFLKNTRLIRNYWIFIIIFVSGSTAIYWIILSSSTFTDKNLAISIANQASGLIFAIFTGYFAFSQVMESRFEKYDSDGLGYLTNSDYTEAIKAWEQALSIKRKNPTTLGNLLEVYAIKGDYDKIEERIEMLKRITPPERQEIPFIILTAMYLFKGYLNDANDSIEETIRIIQAKNRPYHSRWEFNNLKRSPRYQALQGDTKKLFDNYAAFVLAEMTEDNRNKFVSGDYLLA
jgi:tetratricopeptide (TPR) repeat protein